MIAKAAGLVLLGAMNIGLIDYGGGNLRSVRRAFERLGAEVHLVASVADMPTDGGRFDALVFPGQGAFGESVRAMCDRGLWGVVAGWLAEGWPFFGICIGYQLLFERSEESPETRGLGILGGEVVRFPADPTAKVPHMGWNVLQQKAGEPLWAGLAEQDAVYFVHSYFPQPAEETEVIAWAQHGGVRFAAAVRRGQLVATQFHPEKSQEVGRRILQNFLDGISAKK